jgi:hypothetical protein
MTREDFLHEIKNIAETHKANIEAKREVSRVEDSVCNRLIRLIDLAHKFIPEGELDGITKLKE